MVIPTKGVKTTDFDQIYEAYFKDVFRYLRSLSANEALAEEITQEAFVKALHAIDIAT